MNHSLEVHPHWHTEVEILYFIRGTAKQQVNDYFFIAEAGDIVIINKNQLHSTYSYEGEKCDILVIMFDTYSVLESSDEKDEHSAAFFYSSSIRYKNPIKPCQDPKMQILECLNLINEELIIKSDSYRFIITSHLYKLTYLLTQQSLYDVFHINENSLRKVKQMLQNTFKLIDDSYYENISLKRAAASSNLSIPHFCKIFKEATGMTFNDYLSFYRVNRSERLLASDKSITEIALECGFGSLSTFIRNFKKHKKIPPSEYKRLI